MLCRPGKAVPVCVCVCVFVCVYVMSVRVHVCICVCACAYVCVYICLCVHVCACVYLCVCMHGCMCAHVHLCVCVYASAYVYVCMCAHGLMLFCGRFRLDSRKRFFAGRAVKHWECCPGDEQSCHPGKYRRDMRMWCLWTRFRVGSAGVMVALGGLRVLFQP